MIAALVLSVAVALPPCAVEDASSGPVPCVWLASEAGDVGGKSFRVYKNDHFKYISRHAAKRLLGMI